MADMHLIDDNALADAIKQLSAAVDSLRIIADLVRKQVAAQPEWTVNVQPPDVTVKADVSPPDVNVNVDAPKLDTPVVNVQMAPGVEKPKRLTVHRDANGYIDYIDVKGS